MHYVIYIDVLFVVNFIMDYVVLSITTTILYHITTLAELPGSRNVCIKYIKRIVASVMGAIWATIVIWKGLGHWGYTLVSYIAIGPMMLAIVTGRMRLGEFIKSIGVMYGVTFILSGTLYAVYNFTLVGYFVHNMVHNSVFTPKLWILPVGIVICNVLVKWLVVFISERGSKKGLLCTAIIENNHKKIKLTAFYDTGNSLKDPIYGEWVHIVLTSSVKGLNVGQNSLYHLIPYSSIGNENGLIPVVRMEKLKIICEKEIITIEKPLFALYSGRFSRSTPYSVILNPNVERNGRL